MSVLSRRELLARRLVVTLAGAAMITTISYVYAPARVGTFIWDDHVLVERDAAYRHVSMSGLFTKAHWLESPLADVHAPYYRPLTLLSFRFDAGLDNTARQYHSTNVALHALAAALVAVVARRSGASTAAAILCALVWGVLPRLSESVVWISGRTDMLACVFGLAALAVSPDLSAGERGLRWMRSVISGALLFAALASKEVGLAFGVALMVQLVLRLRDNNGEPVRVRFECIVRFATTVMLPCLAYAVLRWLALSQKTANHSNVDLLGRLATALEAIGRYGVMLLDPLHPATSIGLLGELDARYAAAGLTLVLMFALASWRYGRRVPDAVIVAGALSLTGLGLVLHVVPIALAGAVAADRLLYVPSAGIAMITATVVSNARLSKRWACALGGLSVVVTLVFARATTLRIAEYADEALFWTAATEDAHAHNPAPLLALAGVVRDAGETERACRLFDHARRLVPPSRRTTSAYRRARENLVSCWARSGRYAEALALAEELANEYAGSGRVQMELAFARLHIGDFERSEQAFSTALRLDPTLEPVVRPAMDDLSIARSEARAFGDRAVGREERFRYAQHLARVGHLPEAEKAYLEVALDTGATAEERRLSLSFLLRNAHVDVARRALDASPPLSAGERMQALHSLDLRDQHRAHVLALSPRIDALMSANPR